MKTRVNLTETIAAKIANDPKTEKMIALAVRHDHTFPAAKRASIGPNASDHDIALLWANMVDNALANSEYGDLSRDGKFDQWLLRLYMNHVADYEDISGEGVPALGQWKALSIRNLLRPEHQDFNRFRSLEQLYNVVRSREYRDALARIKDAERIAKMKRDKKEIILINDDRFFVMVPLNYGSCYIFNWEEGVRASFCTGSSGSEGERWFNRYSKDGPIVSIIDKKNMNDPKGKWQMHSETNQLVDANQNNRGLPHRNDAEFAELFPGLMKQIVSALGKHSEDLKQASKDMGITPGGWNIAEEVGRIKRDFPTAFASEPKENPEQPALA